MTYKMIIIPIHMYQGTSGGTFGIVSLMSLSPALGRAAKATSKQYDLSEIF